MPNHQPVTTSANPTSPVAQSQTGATVASAAPTPTTAPAPIQDQTVDLDQFLNLQPQPSNGGALPKSQLPEADRIAVVGIFLDDSGSMDHLRRAVVEGLNLSVEAFRGAKGSDFYLDVRGFKGPYFNGLLKEVQPDTFAQYQPPHD